ncbi:MAG: hypothetical protein QF926_15250 [Alphaproteobacteria bacterium]|nr:hypothetical protein [Alphaproteobacteria bacterium]MDP6517960.1 hypothetical protein [Alphaproteobacteria bacterium]
MAGRDVERKLAPILSTDGVGTWWLMAGDEAATLEKLKEYRATVRILMTPDTRPWILTRRSTE